MFCEYIGNFNEGYMFSYILSSEIELYDKQQILEIVKEKTLLTVEVTDDGGMLEVSRESEKITTTIR